MVSLPKTSETGIHFNRNRPSWAVTYWEAGVRKYRHFFVPDLSPEVIEIVLHAAVKLREKIEESRGNTFHIPPSSVGGYGLSSGKELDNFSNLHDSYPDCLTFKKVVEKENSNVFTLSQCSSSLPPSPCSYSSSSSVGSPCTFPSYRSPCDSSIPSQLLSSTPSTYSLYRKLRRNKSAIKRKRTRNMQSRDFKKTNEKSRKVLNLQSPLCALSLPVPSFPISTNETEFKNTVQSARPVESNSYNFMASHIGVTTRGMNHRIKDSIDSRYNWIHDSNTDLAYQWYQALLEDINNQTSLSSSLSESKVNTNVACKQIKIQKLSKKSCKASGKLLGLSQSPASVPSILKSPIIQMNTSDVSQMSNSFPELNSTSKCKPLLNQFKSGVAQRNCLNFAVPKYPVPYTINHIPALLSYDAEIQKSAQRLEKESMHASLVFYKVSKCHTISTNPQKSLKKLYKSNLVQPNLSIIWDSSIYSWKTIWYICGVWKYKYFPCENSCPMSIANGYDEAKQFLNDLKKIAKELVDCYAKHLNPKPYLDFLMSFETQE